MPAKFNFEEYLIGLGAIRSKELHAQGMGAMKVAEYEYKDFQFVIITNELGIKTQLVIMKNWNPLESRYCCYVPKTESGFPARSGGSMRTCWRCGGAQRSKACA